MVVTVEELDQIVEEKFDMSEVEESVDQQIRAQFNPSNPSADMRCKIRADLPPHLIRDIQKTYNKAGWKSVKYIQEKRIDGDAFLILSRHESSWR